MSSSPRLQLLGTPGAHDGARALRFPDRKGLALLAVLAVDGPSSRANLASLLWDDLDSDIRRNLRRTLHRLREAGFEALLDTEGDVLSLHPSVQLDLAAAQAWIADTAEPPLQAPVPLAGLEATGALGAWLMALRDRWAQAWRQAAERQATHWQAAGQARRALGWARALLHADGLQEGHCVRAMTLHAELGEREAALAVYEQCRKALARELGLRPLATTQALAEQLRAGGAAGLAAPTGRLATTGPITGPITEATTEPITVAWLPTALPLVGREAELQRVLAALAEGRLVLLRAPAGTGKTRLVQALTDRRPGVLRLHECRPGDRQVPFAALVRWLRALAPADAGAALPTWVRAELARLLPELGSASPEMTTPAQRLRLFEAVREAWERWQFTTTADAVPVFDDWHFVDEASAEWWLWWRGQQGPAGPAHAALVCQRPGDETSPAAAAMLAQALAEAPSLLLELPSLGAESVLELVSRLSGVARPVRFASRLWSATGGLPLYLVETLRHLLQTQVIQLDAQGRWSTPFDSQTQDYAELPVAPSVQEALMQRLRALDEATRRLLDAACVADDDFDLSLVAHTSALPEPQAVTALEQAVRARVLAPSGTRTGHWRFEHEVFAQALQAELLPERRRLLHGAWAQRLVATGGSAARVAAHLEAADDRAAAVEWHLRALAQARQRQARAAQQWHAERLLTLGASGAARLRALLALAWTNLVLAQPDAAGTALDEAFALARAGLPADEAGALWVDLLCAHTDVCRWRGQRLGGLAALAAAEADRSLDDESRAQLKRARGKALGTLGRYAEGEAVLREALALVGDEPGSLRAGLLDDLARTVARAHRIDEAALLAAEALQAAQAADNRALSASAGTVGGITAMMRGRFEEAVAQLSQARAIAAAEGLVSIERGTILNLVASLLALGRRGEALAAVDEGYALSRQFTGPSEEQAFVEARYQCRVDTGDLAGAYGLVAPLLALTGQADAHRRTSALSVLLDLPLTLGDTEAAAPLVVRLMALDPAMLSEQHGMAQAKAAWLALLQDRLDEAGALLDAAEASPTQRPESLAYRVSLRSLWLARQGQTEAARRHREQLRREGVSTEVWALALSLVLALPGPAASWEAAAEDTLAQGNPPPLGRLLLLDVLQQRQGATRWADPAHAAALALHGKLAALPAAQACFARRFAACLGT
jgi:DNA-binding SARP family transcriptional activator